MTFIQYVQNNSISGQINLENVVYGIENVLRGTDASARILRDYMVNWAVLIGVVSLIAMIMVHAGH